MEEEFEEVAQLEAQEQSLKMDAGELHSQIKSAKAEEARLRELVEVYGQGHERGALSATRRQIAQLEAEQKANEKQRAGISSKATAIQRRHLLVGDLAREHGLTSAQGAKLREQLKSGTPEKEVRGLAAKWGRSARLDALTSGPRVVQETEDDRSAARLAQTYGLTPEEHKRVLAQLRSGGMSFSEARDFARELYRSRSGDESGKPSETLNYSFQTSGEVSW